MRMQQFENQMGNPRLRELYKKMTIFKDNYIMFPSYWILNTGNSISDILEKFILELHQHGHIVHFVRLETPRKIPQLEDPGPQILTMTKLSAGFIVWLVAVLAACITFVGELVVNQISKRIAKINTMSTRKKQKKKKKKSNHHRQSTRKK